MSSFLVTGGAGFIGSNICEELIRRGHKVRVIDDLSTGNIDNIKGILSKIEFINDSICNADAIKKACCGMDFVLHQAAIPSVPRSVKDPLTSNHVNIDGTLNVLLAARDSGVRKVVFAASSSAYGESESLPKKEEMKPMPLSPYAISKLAGEHYCKVFCDLYGIETVSLRYFNVFGPKQDPASEYAAVVPKFISSILAGRQPLIYGDGLQTRDFTFIKNVVEANILCTERKLHGEVLNIATGSRITLIRLVEMLNSIIGSDIEPELGDEREGDIRHSLADISLAEKVIGYRPKICVEEGLKETVRWFKNKKSS
ncbi:SDR family oxidoreductase [Candidatus Woesearchaeota archaeon]|nr:SDR family oxidoreductase [Candidatus Woesearchaeota archaeon]